MRRKFWEGISAVAAIVAGAGAAGAADLAVKAPVYKAPVILSDWAGFYIGVHGGYGWGDMKFDPAIGLGDAKGGLFGGHAGYNWQYGSVIAGLEVDFDGADLNSKFVAPVACIAGVPCILPTMKFDELATARARLGYAVLPDLLAYGTAGAASGHSRMTRSAIVAGAGLISGEANASNFGWVAGAGLEYHLWHGFIARAEYLHYDFATATYSFPTPIDPVNAGTTINVVRGGLSYKF